MTQSQYWALEKRRRFSEDVEATKTQDHSEERIGTVKPFSEKIMQGQYHVCE